MRLAFLSLLTELTDSRPKHHLSKVLDELVNDKNRVDHESYHEINLRHWTPESEVMNLYGVLNLAVASINDRELETWAASEKLFPWVAVAAPLKVRLILSSCQV